MIKIFNIFLNKSKFSTPAQKGFQKSKVNFRSIGKGVIHNPINIKYGKDNGILLTEKLSPASMKIVNADKINTIVEDMNEKELGFYEYYIDWQDRTIKKGNIMVNCKEQRKGLGEILRLSSLIEFRKNNLNKINIFAAAKAIPFHIKYKFRPNFENKQEILNNLQEIQENTLAIEYFRRRAKKLARSIQLKPNESIDKKELKEINQFFYAFIKQHLFKWQDSRLKFGIPMELTKETVNGAADFFNRLFEKHGIDYRL